MQERSSQNHRGDGRIRIRPGAPQDLPAVQDLLAACDLPYRDPALAQCRMLVAEDDSGIVGCAGLELCGKTALLRSVAVAPRWRGKGVGRELTIRALHLAEALRLESLYLLTTTAADFFARLGFRAIERDQAPAAIRATGEFRSLCPASAVVMMRPVAAEIGDG